MRYHKEKNSEGFTLFGLLVAISIFVVVMMAVVSLSVRVIRTTGDSENHFIATALAREGIELVRSLRDDNYFNYDPSSDDIDGEIYWRGLDSEDVPVDPGVDKNELIRASICNGRGQIIDPVIENGSPALWSSLEAAGDDRLYFDTQEQRYVHDATAGPESPFWRVITIVTDGEGNCGELSEAMEDPPRPFYVISLVGWEGSDGELETVELIEKIYAIVRVR